jgi:general secretion pathway protein A
MYTQWFKLDRLPFRLRPDPQFLFMGGKYGQAVLRLRALVDGGHGLVTLTGEPGSGKSTVLHALADDPGDRRLVARVWQPDLPPPKLLEALHDQLALPSRHGIAADSIDQLARRIAEEHGRGRQVLIVVDDAHNMPAGTLRQLLRVVALQPPPLLLLSGEPHLLELLQWRALEKPPTAAGAVELPRFDLADTEAYVPERLRVAGAATPDIFEPDALPEVQSFSGGVPALINVLCDAAMNQAMARFSRTVGLQDVRSAARSLHWVAETAPEEPQPEPASREPVADDAPVHRIAVARQAPPLTPAPPASASGAVLQVARKGQPVAQFALAPGNFVVGRTADCDLRLEGNFVSRRHCQIVTTAGRSVVEDLGSTNGIAVNGSRHQRGLRHPLSPGDEVRIGDYTLTYLDADAGSAPAHPAPG